MIKRRQIIARACIVWSITIVTIGVIAMPSVNDDAIALVLVATAATAIAAVGAARELIRGHDRIAGALLVASVAAPTFMAYVVGVPALIAGIVLLVRPRLLLPRERPGAFS